MFRLKRTKHPVLTNRFKLFLANTSLFTLVLYFVFTLICVSFSLAISYNALDSGSQYEFVEWWKFSFLQLLLTEYESVKLFHGNILQVLLFFSGNLFAVIFPAIFLGAIVFKLIISKKVFVFRSMISLYPREDDSYYLALRLYNSTKLEIVDISFKAFLRVRHAVPGASPKLENVKLTLENPE